MEERIESKDYRETCLTRQQIVDFLNTGKPRKLEVNIAYVQTKLELILDGLKPCLRTDLSDSDKVMIAKEAAKMYHAYQDRWRKSNFVRSQFERKHGEWSRKPFNLPQTLFAAETQSGLEVSNTAAELRDPDDETSVNRTGPDDLREMDNTDMSDPTEIPNQEPGPSFLSLASRTQRKRIQDIKKQVGEVPVAKLLKVIAGVAKKQEGISTDPDEKKYLESVSKICKTATISPGRPLKIVESIKDIGKVKHYSPEEALALCIDLNLTRDKYQAIREGNQTLPPQHLINDQKKACYPAEEISVTSRRAWISLSSLLSHTTSRIIKLQEEPECLISNYAQTKCLTTLHLNFYYSWGFDGSSGHSGYKQGWDDDERGTDHSLFATTIIPLRLVDPSNPNRPLWQNPTPQSVRYCRPLRLQFIKETIDVIHEERKWVDDQINSLDVQTFQVKTSDGEIDVQVTYKLNLTLIDGKVLGAITNTRSLKNCCLCQAKEKEFHDLSRVWRANTDALEYGLSPLHAWIRTLEFLLNLGYKNGDGIRRKVVYKKSDAGKRLEQRTLLIKQRIKDEFNLTVDAPKPGGAGSTNDGNTARMLLSDKNRKKFAEILGLKEWLLDELHILLTVISCGLEIDSVKFGDFCNILRVRYITEYNWYTMPSTIHKLLAHGKAVVEAMALPIGMFSEQASESCNKLYKRNRRSSTTKSSRKDTMLVMFRRSLESSDPIISHYRLERRQRNIRKLPLPPAAVNLLKPVILDEIDAEADQDTSIGDISFDEGTESYPMSNDGDEPSLQRPFDSFEIDVCRAALSDEDVTEDEEESLND